MIASANLCSVIIHVFAAKYVLSSPLGVVQQNKKFCFIARHIETVILFECQGPLAWCARSLLPVPIFLAIMTHPLNDIAQ